MTQSDNLMEKPISQLREDGQLKDAIAKATKQINKRKGGAKA
jgi:hypothetical protein